MAEYSKKSLWYLEVSLGTPEIRHSSSWYPWGILVVKRQKIPCGILVVHCGILVVKRCAAKKEIEIGENVGN
jgi:hypothetical protein